MQKRKKIKPTFWLSQQRQHSKTITAHRNEPAPISASQKIVSHDVFAAVVLCLLVAISYFPATLAGFVWDDATITGSKEVSTLSGLWDIWFSPGSIHLEAHYWPVVYTTFWLEHKLWGFAPVGYHIVNLLLHTAVTVLLWRLLLRLKIPAAWVIAAVFAVHPLHVESVVWVIERKDLLSGLFYLSCVFTYIRFMETRRRGHYIWMLALFVLGMLSKSIVVTLPTFLLIWHWWKQGCIRRSDILQVLPLFLLGLLIALGDLHLARLTETIVSDYSLFDRIIIAARSLWFYVGKLLWPMGLAVIYPRWSINATDLQGWGYVVALCAAFLLLWAYRQRIGRGPLAGILFFAVTLSPTLGFLDYGFMRFAYVADRFQYLAGIGIMATLIGAVTHYLGRSGASRMGLLAMTAVLLVILGTLTWQQAGIYRNHETFYSHIISLNPRALSAHYGLGNEYQRQGRLDEALANYRIALQLEPNSYMLHNQMSLLFKSLGRFEEAEKHSLRTLEIRPNYPTGLNNLAALRVRQKRYQEALALYQTALKIDPGFSIAHSGMGTVLLQLGQPEAALRSFGRALAIEPTLRHALINQDRLLKSKHE